MSWVPNRQQANTANPQPQSLVSLQQPLQAQVGAAAGGPNDHGSAVPFGSQSVWKPNFNQQQLMQPIQQPPPNNWATNPMSNAFQQKPDNNVLTTMSQPNQQQPLNNNWTSQDYQVPPVQRQQQAALSTSGYFLNNDNFNQPQQQQQYPTLQPAPATYPTPQQYQQQNVQQPIDLPQNNNTPLVPVVPVSYSRQTTQQMDSVQEAAEYFDNRPNNSNDGWGDWDWNENNPQKHQQQEQQPQLQQPHVATAAAGTLQANSTGIDDSFRIESNDNWQWGLSEENAQQSQNQRSDDLYQNSQKPNEKNEPPPLANNTGTLQQPLLTTIPQPVEHDSTIQVKPTNLPLNDLSSLPESTQVNNNIPSPVYVSQAKPVPKPPRQFASPPGTLHDTVNSIGPTTPPHAFQNRPEQHPPPPAATASTLKSTATLPPPMVSSVPTSSAAPANNPFKRSGLPQHHRVAVLEPPANVQQSNIVSPPAAFYASPPPPPEDFANPSVENHEVIAPDNSEILHENQEIAPNNDRNEYLQTSHLSEIGGGHADNAFNIATQEQYNESDDFPPPGLSRLVLGQPENESRQILGTEDASSLNIERQADGEDTDPTQPQRSTFVNSSDNNQNNSLPSQIDITADRNLYLVPGESDVQEQRVVTGLEDGSSATPIVLPIQVEQREVELDGENVEDQHQNPQPSQTSSQHHHNHQHRPISPVQNARDEELDGANSFDRQVQGSQNKKQETSAVQDINLKDLSNISTGNDESDQRDRHYNKSRRLGADNETKKRRPVQESKENRYESEESEFSSDRERRRYREGSVRSERDRERDSKERKRRDKRDRDAGGERVRERYRGDDRDNRYREKMYHDREGKQSGRYAGSRYDADSKYETESSMRIERRRGADRGDRVDRADRGERGDREAYEEYRRYKKYDARDERGGHERRGGHRTDGDRRRVERDYRDDRDIRRHKESREKTRNEYDEYRKTSSRNARESDIEKDTRIREKDPRYAGHSMYAGYSGYGYDPYAAYYYEQMVRTNPQAYSEWYKKYYGQAPTSESMANNGRESVHSGRSSANNEKDRYTVQHHQYIPHPTDYQRHFMPPGTMAANMSSVSMNSTMNESQHQQAQQQRMYGLSGGTSTGNLSQINPLSGPDYYASTARSYYARSEYSESRPDNLSLNLVDAATTSTQEDPQRLTPQKFTSDHPIVSLGPGLMVAVKPNYSHGGITNVVKIFRMGCNDATNKLFQSFPGPLVRGLTHKKTIIEFCEDQIRLGPYSAINRSRQNSTSSLSTMAQASRPSFTLMWNLLILLLRQNGMVVGTDIAELLIKNQQQFPYEIPRNSVDSNSSERESELRKSKENTPSDPEQNVDELSEDESDEQTSSKAPSLSEEEITEKFRNYLLYGNVNEALDWATDKNLWGHALFLASKVDRRSHANVMMKFANKLALNDPLQTLYQLMSGRTPSSVTSVQDEKWGDWRPHLSMILSNTSQKPELDRKAITTLGDSLFNRGDLFAAHFCYLMAQVGFNKYPEERSEPFPSQNSVRLVLLGSSHQKEFEEFATNESIMMTEVYEYACSLNDDKFSLVEFQPYKYLLATRMLDYGYQLKCLMYMEQISLHIKRDPAKYEPMFISQVYELADRLKYYDPVLEKSMDEMVEGSSDQNNDLCFDEQPWLQELHSLALNHAVQSNSQNINQDYHQTSNAIDQQFAEINRQFNELNLQYDNSNTLVQDQQQMLPPQADPTQMQYMPPTDVSQIPQSNEQMYPQFYNPLDGQMTQNIAPEETTNINTNGYMQPPLSQESYQQQSMQSNFDGGNNQTYASYRPDDQQNYWANQPPIQNDELEDKSNSKSTSQSDNSDSMSNTTKSQRPYINGPHSPLCQSKHLNMKTKNTSPESPESFVPDTSQLLETQKTKPLNLMPVERNFKSLHKHNSPTSPGSSGTIDKSQKHQQPYNINTDTARPTITMPNTQSQKSGSNNDGSSDSKHADAKKSGDQGSSSAGTKTDSKNAPKGGQSSSQNSGWFGGIWNKLSLKPKNQMILPDDKNPAIVWDAEKKKWVNTDGDEQSEESLKPPPKMSDLVPRSSQAPPTSMPSMQQQSPQALPLEEAAPQQLVQTMPVQNQDSKQTFSAVGAAPSYAAPTLVEPTKPPSLQSNMFKMQRNRTLKNSYVDVFNPSGAQPKSTEQVLAPALPPAAVPAGSFFVPGAAPNEAYQPQQQSTQEGGPQFYNPNQFGGYQN